jgi:hypothetical protein
MGATTEGRRSDIKQKERPADGLGWAEHRIHRAGDKMTGKRTFDAWEDETITDPTELLVMMAICDEAGEDGRSRPRIQDIAKKARCDDRTAIRKIKALIKSGKIQSTRRYGTSNEYQLLVLDSDKLSPSPEKPIVTDCHHLTYAKSPHSISTKNLNTILSPQQQMVGALAKVLNGNATLMGPRLGRFASQMIKVGATPEKVVEMYSGPQSWWFQNNWKGLKGQTPTETDIRATWDHWDVYPSGAQSGPCIDDLMKP